MRALAALLRGATLVYFRHPGLARIWGIPVAITALLFVLLTWSVVRFHDHIVEALIWEQPVGPGAWRSVLGWLHSSVEVLLGLLIFGLGAFVILASVSVIAAPFNDLLSERVEAIACGRRSPPFKWRTVLREGGRAILLESLKIAIYLVVIPPLFVVSLAFPVAGQLVYSVAGYLLTSSYLTMDYIDWPIARRGLPVAYRFRLWRKYPLTFVIFGACVWALLLVPVVNLFTMPAAVAGATLLYLDLSKVEDSACHVSDKP